MRGIAVAGVPPVTGDAPCKGGGETSRSEWRLGVFHLTGCITRSSRSGSPGRGTAIRRAAT